MAKPEVKADELAKCLAVLRQASEPMTAIEIAARLGLGGIRETQRRHVRAIVKLLRDKSCRIAATLQGGYFITNDEQLWRDYLEGRQIDAKRVLGETGKRKNASYDGQQGLLFGQRFTTGAYAACGMQTRS